MALCLGFMEHEFMLRSPVSIMNVNEMHLPFKSLGAAESKF